MGEMVIQRLHNYMRDGRRNSPSMGKGFHRYGQLHRLRCRQKSNPISNLFELTVAGQRVKLTPANVLKYSAETRACSSRRYHIEVSRMQQGSRAASKTPRKNRATASVAKLLHPAMEHIVMPQSRSSRPINLPIGTLVRIHRAGISMPRYPK